MKAIEALDPEIEVEEALSSGMLQDEYVLMVLGKVKIIDADAFFDDELSYLTQLPDISDLIPRLERPQQMNDSDKEEFNYFLEEALRSMVSSVGLEFSQIEGISNAYDVKFKRPNEVYPSMAREGLGEYKV